MNMKIEIVNSGLFKLDGGAMHGVVPKSMWQKVNPADETNMCTWAMHCLLLDTGDRRVIIDTGMGQKQDQKFFSHFHPHGPNTLDSELERLGYKPNEITDIFLTHLHFDHCGGAIKKVDDQFLTTFPNATYWSHEAHWKEAVSPNAREKASFLKENILPIEESGQLKLITSETWKTGLPFFEDIKIVHGHTESMMLPLIKMGNRKILFCADLIPSHAHLSIPWVMAYDMRPLDTLNEKAQILQEALDGNWLLIFEHDPKIECCTLTQTEKGIRSEKFGNLADLLLV